MSEKKYQLDSDDLKKSVDNLCVDLISICDDFMIDIQEEQENHKLTNSLATHIIGNILICFNVNLIFLMKKNCKNLNVFNFINEINTAILSFFETTKED